MAEIKEVEFRRPKADQGMIEEVENLLEAVKAGEVESLVFANLNYDKKCWCYMSETENWLEQVGMVHVLKSDIETKSTRAALRDLGVDC